MIIIMIRRASKMNVEMHLQSNVWKCMVKHKLVLDKKVGRIC